MGVLYTLGGEKKHKEVMVLALKGGSLENFFSAGVIGIFLFPHENF